MPATRRKYSRKNPTPSIVPNNFNLTDASTWYLATMPQLRLLSAESLRLYLTARNLVSTGNISITAQRLYDSIHSIPPDHSSSLSANLESSPMQSNQPTVINNATSDTIHTIASDQQVSLGSNCSNFNLSTLQTYYSKQLRDFPLPCQAHPIRQPNPHQCKYKQ